MRRRFRAAKELKIASADTSHINGVAEAYVNANLSAYAGANLVVDAQVQNDPVGVTVNLSYSWEPIFAKYFKTDVTPVKVSATAELAGTGLVCVVGLMPRDDRAGVHLDNNARLLAENCGVYSNSPSFAGIRADSASSLIAQTTCSAGGVVKFGEAEFIPEPITDCPILEDPLIERSSPALKACNASGLVITDDEYVLSPGVYCDGLTITDEAEVTLKPGIYTIRDGPFVVSGTATLKGYGVGFYLNGESSTFEF